MQIDWKQYCKVWTKVGCLRQFPNILLNFFSNKSVRINIVNIREAQFIFL